MVRKKIVFLMAIICFFAMGITTYAKLGPVFMDVRQYDLEKEEYISSSVPQVNLNIKGKVAVSDVPGYISEDRTMVPVRIISENLEAVVDWDPDSLEVTIDKGDKRIVLTIGSSVALVNDTEVDMPDGVPAKLADIGGTTRTMVPIRFISEQLEMEVTWIHSTYTATVMDAKEYTSYNDVIVMIDPGHGGKDVGANYGGVYEKDLNLDTSLRLRTLLESAGFDVKMVRSDDTFVDKYVRAEMANAAQSDIFMSVHHNASTKSDPNGVLTIYDGTHKVKENFGKIVQKNLVSVIGSKDAGVINKNTYVVTRETNMASALAELGFMSNPTEFAKIQTAEYKQTCAEAMYYAILEYTDIYFLGDGNPENYSGPINLNTDIVDSTNNNEDNNEDNQESSDENNEEE